MTSLDELTADLLRNPAVRAAYEALENLKGPGGVASTDPAVTQPTEGESRA